MSRSRGSAVAACILAALLSLPGAAGATPFVFVGPRAQGMGGAGVSATNDAHAVYWNPAAMTNRRALDIRISGTVRFTNQTELEDVIDKVKDTDFENLTPEEQERLETLLQQLDTDTSTQVNGGGGGFVQYNFGNHFLGFSFSDVATGTANIPFIDPRIQIIAAKLTNGTFVRSVALEAREIDLSYAYSFFDGKLGLGVTGKAIQGISYVDLSLLQDAESGLDFAGSLSKSNDDWEPSVDVGAVYTPTPWLRFGIVGKYLNRPSFDIFPEQGELIRKIEALLPPNVMLPPAVVAAQQAELELAPQGRASFSVYPIRGMTLTADVDVTANPTFVPDNNSQIMSVGGEQLFFDEILAARLGLYYDFVAPNSDVVPTIGLGVDVAGFTFDLGGGYDFQEDNAALGIGFGYHM